MDESHWKWLKSPLQQLLGGGPRWIEVLPHLQRLLSHSPQTFFLALVLLLRELKVHKSLSVWVLENRLSVDLRDGNYQQQKCSDNNCTFSNHASTNMPASIVYTKITIQLVNQW